MSKNDQNLDVYGNQRSMMYNIKNPESNFLNDLDDRLEDMDIRYDKVEATDKNYHIHQQDFYCAVVQHALG